MLSQNIFWNGQWCWLSWTFRTCCTLCVSATKSWSCWYSSDLLSNFGERIFLWLAVATFYAPSDLCGVGGMHHQRIHACSSWRNGPPHYDPVFAEKDPSLAGFRGLFVAQVILFFSYFLSMCFSPVVQCNWRGTLSTHWHVDGRTRVWWKWGESCECYSLG